MNLNRAESGGMDLCVRVEEMSGNGLVTAVTYFIIYREWVYKSMRRENDLYIFTTIVMSTNSDFSLNFGLYWWNRNSIDLPVHRMRCCP